MKFLVIYFTLVLGANCQTKLPSFTWEDDGQIVIPKLRISFPDGGKDDFAILKYYNPVPQGRDERVEDIDHCIFDGYLKDESKVYVTLTGCPNSNNFQIQFRSDRLPHHMFKVVDGRIEAVESIFGSRVFSRSGNFTTVKDAVVKVPRQTRPNLIAPNAQRANPNGYQLRIKVRYDEAFFGKFGRDSINAVRRVMAQAQNIWRWKDSLGTSLNLLVHQNVDAIRGRYVAEDDLDNVAKISRDDVDANVFFTFRNNQPGTVGIAYMGTVCGPANLRTSLNEYFMDDLRAGQTVAHEIGHNMGMDHDFVDDPSNFRYDSRGRQCSHAGGVMDYYGEVNRWSTCSVEDLNNYIAENQPFCLKPNYN